MCRQQTSDRDYMIQYAEQYMGKVFYFCLKKTGALQEAEDLTSDISLSILTELKKGVVPVHFPAWVWQIARNRYSHWAKQKRKAREQFYGEDIDAFEIAGETGVEDQYLRSEELSLLKRELAFVSYNYRRILIAYYMEERTIREIAKREELSEGAVKMRLLRARTILKEGMEMAREFGTKSYNPEEITFAASGKQPSGLPWSAVNRMLPRNILLQADNNPSTIEELSMEMGIAAPYMEEECELLCKATLLKKTGDRYVTNFAILDKECQQKIYQAQLEGAEEHSRLVDAMAEDMIPVLEELQAVRNGMRKEDVKWFAVTHIADYCAQQVNGFCCADLCEVRENGETWGFIGYENTNLPKMIMGHNGNGTEKAMFWAYKIRGYDLWHRAGEMNDRQTLLLGDLLRNRRDISTLTESEKEVWEEICGKFAHSDEKGTVIPDILVFEDGALQDLQKAIRKHPLYSEVMEMQQVLFDKIFHILESCHGSMLHQEFTFYASMETLDIRQVIVNKEVENGRLKVPEDPSKSTLAMYMELPSKPWFQPEPAEVN